LSFPSSIVTPGFAVKEEIGWNAGQDPTRRSAVIDRRRVLALGAAAVVRLLAPFPVAHAGNLSDLRFRVLLRRSTIGEHNVTFRMDGDRLKVETRIHIAVRTLFRYVFRLDHDAQEVWQSDRLVSVTSTTDSTTHAGSARFQISGNAVQDGFPS
jgi:hypothetical protein